MSNVSSSLVGVVAAAVLSMWVVMPAAAAGDAQAGRNLAQRWCSGCHVVDQSGRGPDTAPPFPTIARQSQDDQGWLRAWLTAPHPPMPDLNLSRQQIDDVIAYLDSLTPR
jgi:mono/diheme cytochrome c family protein